MAWRPSVFIARCVLSIRPRYAASEISAVCCIILSKRLIDSRALLGKHSRAFLGDVHAVFQTDAEFTVNCDHGLVAETHSRLKAGLVPAYQVSPLVDIEPDAVTGAMRQAGHLIAGAKTEIGNHFSSRRIHRFAGGARPGGGEG